jgi:hypothetical protein
MYHRLRHIGLTFLSLVMLTILPLHANAAWTSGISLSSSYSAAIPTSSGLAIRNRFRFRSQAAVQIDMAPLSLRSIRDVRWRTLAEIHQQVDLLGKHVYRPFWAIGPAASIHIPDQRLHRASGRRNGVVRWYDPAQQAFARSSHALPRSVLAPCTQSL